MNSIKAQALLERFIKLYGGSIPKCAINASSENSDVSFIWTYYYLAVTDLWRATRDERALSMLTGATDWVFTQTDQALGKEHRFDVVTGWNPKTVESRSFAEGYGASPSKKLNPGWTRYIDIGNNTKAFRPEILASGHIGYAIACFIRDAKELHAETGIKSIPSDKFYGWLNELSNIFNYHNPNWRDSHSHSPGVHEKMQPIAGYFWPSAVGAEIWNTQPALNQQAQFLSMGVVVEQLLGKDIGAKDKMRKYCESTLRHLMILDQPKKWRIALRYDLRDHSGMPPEKAEPTSDSVHTQKSMPLFMESEKLGYTDENIHWGILNQLIEVTHLGGGEMAVLMDGTSDHGPKRDHPNSCHLADAVLLKGGEQLIPIYEMALQRDYPNPDNHKAWHLHARLARVKADYLTKSSEVHSDPPSALDEQVQEMVPAPQKNLYFDHIRTPTVPAHYRDDLIEIPNSADARVIGYSREDMVSHSDTFRNLQFIPLGKRGSVIVRWKLENRLYKTKIILGG